MGQNGYIKYPIEAMAIEIVSCPIKSMVMFHSYVKVYQMVNLYYPMVFLWFSH